MLSPDELGELDDVAADYLDAKLGHSPATELSQSKELLVSLMLRLMEKYHLTTFVCHRHRFTLLQDSGGHMLHVSP